MTIVSDRTVGVGRAPGTTAVVLAVVHAVEASAAARTRAALAASTRRPDRVLLLDATADGGLDPSALTPGDASAVTVVRVEPAAGSRAAYRRVLDAQTLVDVTAVWLLPAGTRPQPDALRILLDTLRRSTVNGVVGPKLLVDEGEDGLSLGGLGIAATRSGRVIGTPAPGTPDQGQLDARTDVLAVPEPGMLVEKDVWLDLGGHRPEFGDVAADLDLGWRAQLGDHRVTVAPAARVVVPPGTPLVHADTGARRRASRRVALARCAWWSAPLLAVWVALSAVAGSLALLLAKRPRAAAQELADVGALADPWRPLAARWAGRGRRRVARHHLGALFLRSGDVLRHVSDEAHAALGLSGATGAATTAGAVESGPSDEDDGFGDRGSLVRRLVTNPGLLAGLAVLAVSFAVERTIHGGPLAALSSGLTGGEAVGGAVSPDALIRAWWDGWPDPSATGPVLPLLAGLAWLVAHIPSFTVASPGAAVVAILVVAAPPLATWSAYASGRVVTRTRWLRAVVALAYAGGAATWSAATHARLGALVGLVLIPVVLALAGRIAAGLGTISTAGGLAIALGVLVGFAPVAGAPLLLAAAVLVLFARGAGRWQGALAAVGALLVLGRGAVDGLAHPAHLLLGPGVVTYAVAPPSTLHLAALDPDGRRGLVWLAALPIVAVALFCLVRGRGRAVTQWVLGLGAVAAVALAIASARTVLGSVPAGAPGAGGPLRPWWGVAMMLAWALLLAVVLVGLSDVPMRRSAGGWAAVARWPLAVGLVAGAVIAPALAAQRGGDGGLATWSDPRPAIAVAQAGTPLAGRTLLVRTDAGGAAAQLVDADRTLLVRSGVPARPWEAMSSAAQLVVDGGPDRAIGDALVGLGVGFVGLDASVPAAVGQRLDATTGLTRMGSREGYDFWRVDAPASGAAIGIGRVTVRTAGTTAPVAVSGPNAAVDARIPDVTGPAVLNVAEPLDWSRHSTVLADGRVLHADGAASLPAYALPRGASHLVTVTRPVHPGDRWVQLAGALVLLFLSLPTSRRRRSA